ncbi:MAG: SIMPL domain-containing protein [Pseudomonadales bacterium]|nr:SIMPL domain-containing protein [Pseudomonadales bacterium]
MKKQYRMTTLLKWKRIFSIVIFGMYSSFALAEPEIKGSPQEVRGFLYPNDNVVIISAEAAEKAYSDKAIVSLVITTEHKLLSQAITANSALREKLTVAFIGFGMTADSINSSKFSSSPQYGWFGNKPSSFKIVNRMAISIFNESHLKVIAEAADNHKQVELSDMTFEHTKKDEFNENVKAKALGKIIQQKSFYEKSLGLKLIPIGIRDFKIRQRATRGAMLIEEVVMTAARFEKDSFISGADRSKTAKAPSFDEVKYEANLSVDFKIER